jgi:hypothetical protein
MDFLLMSALLFAFAGQIAPDATGERRLGAWELGAH